ncbi:hypothetical protein DFJ74DRAFT_759264, partial [Hyaloraphidium curvatum]
MARSVLEPSEPEVDSADVSGEPAGPELLPRNLCPVCPAGTVPPATRNSNVRYCCITRAPAKIVTATKVLTATVVKTRTVKSLRNPGVASGATTTAARTSVEVRTTEKVSSLAINSTQPTTVEPPPTTTTQPETPNPTTTTVAAITTTTMTTTTSATATRTTTAPQCGLQGVCPDGTNCDNDLCTCPDGIPVTGERGNFLSGRCGDRPSRSTPATSPTGSSSAPTAP